MCLAVAARIDGTVVSECAGGRVGDLRLGHPSGVLPIDGDGGPEGRRGLGRARDRLPDGAPADGRLREGAVTAGARPR